jgi:iron complex transport system substrate-binding protein
MHPPAPSSTRLTHIARLAAAGALLFLAVATVGALRLAPRPAAPAAGAVARPVRIVAASARLIDLCAALVDPDRIAGYPEQAIEYTTLGDRQAAFLDRPHFRQYLAEPVLSLEPDLVLADPWQSLDTRARLLEAGVPVLILPETHTWPEVRAALLDLGRVLGEEARAAAEVAALDARVAALAARGARPRLLRVVPYANFGAEGFTAGAGTTIDEAIALAGLRNAATEAGVSGHAPMSYEGLLGLDPDAIVVSLPPDPSAGLGAAQVGASEALLAAEPAVASLRAVRERRFLRLPAGLYASSSQGIVGAAELLAAAAERLDRVATRGGAWRGWGPDGLVRLVPAGRDGTSLP